METPASDTGASARRTVLGTAPEVLVLGVVSFLTDVSSEMIFSVLPLFVTQVLGGSALFVGTMEGLADFSASSLDMASGVISDRTGKRKGLAALGYGLSSFSKLLLLWARAPGHVLGFRVVERLGKSIRGAPRDALLAQVAPQERRGFSFGVHKAFDKAGAVLGPLLAFWILQRLGPSARGFHVLFAAALVPAFISVGVLLAFVRERPAEGHRRLALRETLRTLGPDYRHYLASAGLFSLAYFSFAFLLLEANRVGFGAQDVALLYALFNVSFTLVSVPVGRLGDRLGRRAVVALSYALYAAMCVGFLLARSKLSVALLFGVYGAFYAIDEGQTKALISDLAPGPTRGSAIGLYGFVTGLVYLPASVVAGALWTRAGPSWTFGFGAAVATAALLFFTAGGQKRGQATF